MNDSSSDSSILSSSESSVQSKNRHNENTDPPEHMPDDIPIDAEDLDADITILGDIGADGLMSTNISEESLRITHAKEEIKRFLKGA